MASYCLLKLRANKPARGKAPTILEIETGLVRRSRLPSLFAAAAADAGCSPSPQGAAFYPSTFGSTLEDTMAKQAALYPTERVPIVLPFLAQGILAFGGQATEGLFRIPGDSDQVAMVKDRIDRGRYELDGVDDVHVLGSLFKLWLRELQEPLVPGDRYSTALTCVSPSSRARTRTRVADAASLPPTAACRPTLRPSAALCAAYQSQSRLVNSTQRASRPPTDALVPASPAGRTAMYLRSSSRSCSCSSRARARPRCRCRTSRSCLRRPSSAAPRPSSTCPTRPTSRRRSSTPRTSARSWSTCCRRWTLRPTSATCVDPLRLLR